ncbi:MAG: hypothetical protein HFF34_05930 [Oscillospiraceae bacterium]|jgi:hypothetical protein|nr:hypothetical protein [Oscillospiraceae bacterium]MCI9394567.1 hypothetical protein [Oscillospiraceae bacterium]MCI9580895.1 hypothetical protein [Oscillospiraceae bacterium]
MDIKESIEKAVATIAQDKALQEQFKTDPVEAVQKLLGVELPVDVLEKIVAGVKAQLTAGQLAGAADALKKLF